MATMGNTVRLTVTFTDWDATPVDPTGVALRILDADYNQLGATIPEASLTHVSTGVFRYDYTIPYGRDELYAEFSGLSGGTTVLGRLRIDREWVSNE